MHGREGGHQRGDSLRRKTGDVRELTDQLRLVRLLTGSVGLHGRSRSTAQLRARLFHLWVRFMRVVKSAAVSQRSVDTTPPLSRLSSLFLILFANISYFLNYGFPLVCLVFVSKA